ncbi:MAG TPA: NAD(P)-dependent oxidoreductase, partial [Polyangia bacterium]|nr:NAD(P)-dependent oxidoreductase [Polyangia bacterium]
LTSALELYAREVGLGFASGRVFFMYGPHEHPSRLVSSVVRALLARREAPCSLGTQQRDFQHVQDTAGAFVALLESAVAGPVNIGSGRAPAVRDVVRALADRLDGHALVRLGALPMAPDDPPLIVADTRRLAGEVGWTDRFDLASGLDDTIAWWRAQS